MERIEIDVAPTEGIGEKTLMEVHKIINSIRGQAGALIRVLEQTQVLIGYLPPQVLKIISQEMKVPLSEIYGIVSFYHFFTMVPRGKYLIQVCMGTCCYVKGGERILETLKKEYGLEPEETTSDRRFSLDTVRCLGCCALSPVIAIEGRVFPRVSASKVKRILSSYE